MPNPPLQSDASQPNDLVDKICLPTGWEELNLAVALSGGADSMALLRSLQQLKASQSGAGSLVALHVNHQLRAAESADDARWCAEECEKLAIPCQIITCETAQYAEEHRLGIESAARAQRYELLSSMAENLGVRYLATAHTQDDQVETILFRLLRGTGLQGLAGIPPARSLTRSITLIRPLIHCPREMVLRYLSALGQSYRTDSTNADRQFTRNRLRHQLLPLLREQYNQELDQALLRLSTQAAQSQQFVRSHAQQLLDNNPWSLETNSLALPCPLFADQPNIVVCEIIRLAWRKAGLAEQAMTFQWWSKLGQLAEEPESDKVFNLPGNVRASIADNRLLLQW